MAKKPKKSTSPTSDSKSKTAKDSSFNNYNIYTGLNNGGLVNSYSGAGTVDDKGRQSIFLPTVIDNQQAFQTIYTESWACKRFINFPVDCMFVRPRLWENSTDECVKDYKEYLDKFGINTKLSNAFKSGKLMGSAFLVFITNEDDPRTPLNLNYLRAGDLSNVLVFDRYSVIPSQWDYRLSSGNFQKPYMYTVQPKRSGTGFEVHYTRLLRLDGIQPLTADGWVASYNINYGVSEIIPVLDSIYQDSQGAKAISQLMDEASVFLYKADGLREGLGAVGQMPSLEELASTFNQLKSVYRGIYMDANDDASRIDVNFGGIAQVLNCFAYRLAAAAEIPATLFLGKSPDGLNATGESDLRIYAQKIADMQQNLLRPAYTFIDNIMMRTSGLMIEDEYVFPSILDQSDNDKADVLLKQSQALTPLVINGIMTVDEAREVLSKNDDVTTLEPTQEDIGQAVKAEQAKLALQQNKQEQSQDQSQKRLLGRIRDLFKFKDAVPSYKDYPLLPEDTKWDDAKARQQIKEHTKSGTKPNADYKNGFMYYNPEKADTYGAYKLPYVYVIKGKYHAVPRAIFDKVALLNGARGGVDIPESDKAKIKTQVNKYYKKMGKAEPFK